MIDEKDGQSSIEDILSMAGFSRPYNTQGRGSVADLFRRNRCGIYVLHFADGALYVGQAVNVVRRYAQHRQTHKDIQRISFKRVKKQNLDIAERDIVHLLENDGFQLRNIQIVSFSHGETDFELIMSSSEQMRWLNDLAFTDLEGERVTDERLRSLYANKYQEFRQLPHAEDITHVLREYVQNCIPAVKQSEISFWMCSCLPYRSVYSRINVGWQTAFDVISFENRVFYRWYLTRNLVEQVFGWALTEVNEDYGLTLSEFEEYPELVIEVQKSDLTKGGDNQVFVIVEGKSNVINLIHDGYLLPAVRLFNLGLMQKGPCPWGRFHCLDLADQLVS